MSHRARIDELERELRGLRLADAAAQRARSLFAFKVQGLGCAVDLGEAREVLQMVALNPFPGGAAELLGIMTWRGRVVPVIDPAPRLGLSAAPHGLESKLVVASAAGCVLALAVDQLEGVVEAAPGESCGREALLPEVPPAMQGCVLGAVRRPDGLLLLLDLPALLTPEVRALVEASA